MNTIKDGFRIQVKVTDQEKLQMRQLYQEGYSIRAIATQLNRGYTTVHTSLTRQGVALRVRGKLAPKTEGSRRREPRRSPEACN